MAQDGEDGLGRGYRFYRFYLRRSSNHAQEKWKRLFSLDPGKAFERTHYHDLDGR